MNDKQVIIGNKNVLVRDIFAVSNDVSGKEVMIVVLRDGSEHRTSNVKQMKAIEDAFRAYKDEGVQGTIGAIEKTNNGYS